MCIVGGKRPVAKFVTANIIALTSKVGFLRDEKVALLFFFDGQRVEEKIKHSETLRRLKPETQVDSGFF